jgi:diadenosine tetraphosphate (Ap4A) HIT family hydrolase
LDDDVWKNIKPEVIIKNIKKIIDCEFCRKELDTTQEVIRTSLVKVVYPRRPVIEAAVMIMPIRHCENIHDLTIDEQTDTFAFVNKIQKVFAMVYKTNGYNIFANNGMSAGQHIPHVHFHLLARATNEAISPFVIMNNKELYDNIEKLSPEIIKKRILVLRDKLNNLV